jgi:hypothetical protein
MTNPCINCIHCHRHADPKLNKCLSPQVKHDYCINARRESAANQGCGEKGFYFKPIEIDFETAPPEPGRWLYAEV